jgi:hypothetical protein
MRRFSKLDIDTSIEGNHHIYGVVGYTSNEREEELLETISDKIRDLGVEIVDTPEHFKIYDYNLRFTSDAVMRGVPSQIEKLQGVDNIWYNGGLVSHWDVDSISEMSNYISVNLSYTFDNTWYNLYDNYLSLLYRFIR